jgi:hypothetical protein
VIGTYRDVDLGQDDPRAALLADLAGDHPVLLVTGLSAEDVGRVIAQVVGGIPEAALTVDVHRRTGGNPFYVHQVTRLLLAEAGSSRQPLAGPRARSPPASVRRSTSSATSASASAPATAPSASAPPSTCPISSARRTGPAGRWSATRGW